MEVGAGLRPRRRGPGAPVLVAWVVALAAVAAAAGFAGHALLAGGGIHASPAVAGAHVRTDGLRGYATWAAGARPAPPITTLRDQSGTRFDLASLRGRPLAMEFFDSHCTAECPLAGRALAAAERRLPAAQRPVLVVVSVNPKDTPASVRAAVRAWGLAGLAPWHWLMGTHRQLAQVWRAYGIYVKPVRGDIEHTEALFLLDRRLDERSGYLYPYMPASVAHDMQIIDRTPLVSRGARG
ncbi:MAG: SCO family protein [Solirubrobacteraceae bacterium]